MQVLFVLNMLKFQFLYQNIMCVCMEKIIYVCMEKYVDFFPSHFAIHIV